MNPRPLHSPALGVNPSTPSMVSVSADACDTSSCRSLEKSPITRSVAETPTTPSIHVAPKTSGLLTVASPAPRTVISGSSNGSTGRRLWKEKLASIAARNATPTQPPISPATERLDGGGSVVSSRSEEETAMAVVAKVATDAGKRATKQFPLTLRQKVNAIVDPHGSPYDVDFKSWTRKVSNAISAFAFLIIVVSVTTFLVQSLPQYYDQDNEAIFAIETLCAVIFTLELGLRFVTSDTKKAFVTDPLNVIDALAVFPYYIQLFLSAFEQGNTSLRNLTVLRAIRLVRVFRVFKVGKFSESLAYVTKSLAKSLDALYLLLFLILLSCIVFSSAMFVAEQSDGHVFENGTWWTPPVQEDQCTPVGRKKSKFQSIPHSMWWALVTLCTVGYGDTYPLTPWGKVVAAMTMLCGILVVAFPVILIGTNFNEIVSEKKRETDENQRLSTLTEVKVQINTALLQLVQSLKGPEGQQQDEARAPLGLSTVVTGFRWRNQQKAIMLTEVNGRELSALSQFRYDPLFDIPDDCLTVLPTPSPMLHLLSFHVVLDTEEARGLAHSTLCALGYPYSEAREECVFAREVGMMRLSIPNLSGLIPGARLLTTEYYNPPATVAVTIASRSRDSADLLSNHVLTQLALHVAIKWTVDVDTDLSSLSFDFEITVPLSSLAANSKPTAPPPPF